MNRLLFVILLLQRVRKVIYGSLLAASTALTKLSAGRTLTMEVVLELLNILTALNILPE